MIEDQSREVWLPIPDYEGIYEASNLGRIRRDPAGHVRPTSVGDGVLTPTVGPGGYLIVTLSKRGVRTNHRAHRLVLSAFCGLPPFDGAQGAHNDGDLTNCALTNLRWATPLENSADIDRHGTRCRGEDVHCAVLTEPDVRAIRRRIASGERNPSIAGDYGVSISTIHLIRHNKIWRHVA